MRRTVVVAALLAACGAASVPAQAQSQAGGLSPAQTVAERKALMDLQGGVLAAMKAAVDTQVSDIKPYVAGAEALAASTKVIPTLFPAGTERIDDTKAKPEIWSNTAEFNNDATKAQQAAQRLVTLAKAGDTAGFADGFKAMGQACGACHRQFREK